MKAWTDLNLIAKPPAIMTLRTDERGYPIPKFAAIIDGKPDFRVLDRDALIRCIKGRLCAICGTKMNRQCAFVGGPISMQHRQFTDGPMHYACAKYALQVCPMLAAPSFAYRKMETAPPGYVLVENAMTERPEKFGLGVSYEYAAAANAEGHVIVKASIWMQPIEWWKHGERQGD